MEFAGAYLKVTKAEGAILRLATACWILMHSCVLGCIGNTHQRHGKKHENRKRKTLQATHGPFGMINTPRSGRWRGRKRVHAGGATHGNLAPRL